MSSRDLPVSPSQCWSYELTLLHALFYVGTGHPNTVPPPPAACILLDGPSPQAPTDHFKRDLPKLEWDISYTLDFKDNIKNKEC